MHVLTGCRWMILILPSSFEILREGILRDVFSQRASSHLSLPLPWHFLPLLLPFSEFLPLPFFFSHAVCAMTAQTVLQLRILLRIYCVDRNRERNTNKQKTMLRFCMRSIKAIGGSRSRWTERGRASGSDRFNALFLFFCAQPNER